MATIFTKIDREMRKHLHNVRTERIIPGLPPGVLDTTECHVQSEPLRIPGRNSTVVIKGKTDCTARFDDGSFGSIDFKTSASNAEHVPRYSRQLHSYTMAFEHSAPGKPNRKPIKRLGLFMFEPNSFATTTAESANLSGALAWVEVPRDDEAFFGYLASVVDVLDQPTPPPSAPGCTHCQYIAATSKLAL